jgi:hypothetical protein
VSNTCCSIGKSGLFDLKVYIILDIQHSRKKQSGAKP